MLRKAFEAQQEVKLQEGGVHVLLTYQRRKIEALPGLACLARLLDFLQLFHTPNFYLPGCIINTISI